MSPWSHLNYDYVAVAEMLKRLILSPNACVLVHDECMIGGELNDLFFDPNAVFAQEYFWWAEKDGQALFTAFEDWAESAGASGVLMAAEQYADQKKNLKLDRLYARKGYKPVERNFIRTF